MTTRLLSRPTDQPVSDAERRAILRKRAVSLAGPADSQAGSGPHLQVVEFVVGQETYALEPSAVGEVCSLRELTPIPDAPPFVLGVINVRGWIVSLLDLRALLDLPRADLGELHTVIILRSETMEFGLLVDAILGVRSIPLAELQPSLPTLRGIREGWLRGVTHGGTVVLDGAAMLSDGSLVIG